MYAASAAVLLAALPLASASVLPRQVAPTAVLANGTVIGSTSNGIDSFQGIPFAAPPVGPLRLRPPQSYNQQYPGGVFMATTKPRACPQFQNSFPDLGNIGGASPLAGLAGDALNSTFLQTLTNAGEDCLTITIQRPAGTLPNAKLPVLFWIFGGGFEFGATNAYDASDLLQEGISGLSAGNPIIFVAVNYRVNGFGFLAGREMQADGSTNLGLRDQRLGLQWVAENIGAFGGDPDKVTIWGESAGAISVADQTIINRGDHTYRGKPLFRGAIMNSGSTVAAEDVTTPKAQNVYNQVVRVAGCSSAPDALACLRTVSYGTLLYAISTVPNILSYRSLDLAYLPRPDPSSSFFPTSPDAAIASGAFARVPVINGDMEDEGTLFALFQANITTTAQLTTYLSSYYPTADPSIIPGLVATYPQTILTGTDGSPFRTGPLNNIYPQFKRLAAVLGDVGFTLVRRAYLAQLANQGVNVWSYMDSHLYGVPVLGSFHSGDVTQIFRGLPSPITAQTYRAYYTSFVCTLDPNGLGTSAIAPLIAWPKWDPIGAQLVRLNGNGNVITKDDFRSDTYNYLVANAGRLKV